MSDSLHVIRRVSARAPVSARVYVCVVYGCVRVRKRGDSLAATMETQRHPEQQRGKNVGENYIRIEFQYLKLHLKIKARHCM